MTPDHDSISIPTAEQERPADPRPAWERIAYAWLAREVDAGQPVDPTILAGEVSVTAGFARDLVRVLRTHRDHDPDPRAPRRPAARPGRSGGRGRHHHHDRSPVAAHPAGRPPDRPPPEQPAGRAGQPRPSFT